MAEFEQKRLTKLGELLDQHKYLTGNAVSFVDIVVYCEVYQVLSMYNRVIPPHMAKLSEWYDEMGESEVIKEVNQKLNEVIEIHSLMETVPLLA